MKLHEERGLLPRVVNKPVVCKTLNDVFMTEWIYYHPAPKHPVRAQVLFFFFFYGPAITGLTGPGQGNQRNTHSSGHVGDFHAIQIQSVIHLDQTDKQRSKCICLCQRGIQQKMVSLVLRVLDTMH